MRYSMLMAVVVAAAACAKGDSKPDTAAAAAAAPPPAPALALSDFAGTWNVVAKDATTDSTLLTYTLTATADTAGWTINFPNRPPVPVHVTLAGDSLTMKAGPYESMLRKGVQVWTEAVNRLNGGKIVGTSVAHYSVKTADSVRAIKIEGTRAQ